MSAEAWVTLRKAVREAHRLGAEFRIVGADVEIAGDLPASLREALPAALLRQYLGADRADAEAIGFAEVLGAEIVLVTDRAGLADAIGELTGVEHLGIDIETAPPDARPAPVHINIDGALSSIQPDNRNPAGLDPHRSEIQLLQLYGGGERVFVFRGEALQLLLGSRWLREQRLVAHNAGFELAFLQHHGECRPASPVECTMQAAGLLFGPWQRSLADASREVLGAEPPKALQTSCWNAPRLSRGQLAYAASDAVLTWYLWPELRDALDSKGRLAAYELQRDAIPAVTDMQLRGLGFDSAEHARQVDIWSQELAEARRNYLDLAGKPAPSTPVEVRAWVAEVAGHRLAHWPRTNSGELSIEAKHLKRLALAAVPTAKPVLAMLGKAKLLSTFGPKLRDFVNPVTGRIHASYNLAGTKSGRFSASRPNLQQLPNGKAPDFKKCIVAAPGNLLVGGDWSQIELRAAAWISGDPALTAVYEQGRDLHVETAALISGVPAEQVTPEQRYWAKPVNFGSIYGIGPRSLAENAFDDYGVDMTAAEGKAALDRFFQTYRTLYRWMQNNSEMCQRRGYVEIGAGRVVEARWEPGGHLSYPQCCNLPVQGAAADAMLRAITLVHTRLRGLRGGLVATVHDELLLEVAEAEAEAARAILEEAMTEAFAATFPGAPLGGVVAVGVGQSWKV